MTTSPTTSSTVVQCAFVVLLTAGISPQFCEPWPQVPTENSHSHTSSSADHACLGAVDAYHYILARAAQYAAEIDTSSAKQYLTKLAQQKEVVRFQTASAQRQFWQRLFAPAVEPRVHVAETGVEDSGGPWTDVPAWNAKALTAAVDGACRSYRERDLRNVDDLLATSNTFSSLKRDTVDMNKSPSPVGLDLSRGSKDPNDPQGHVSSRNSSDLRDEDRTERGSIAAGTSHSSSTKEKIPPVPLIKPSVTPVRLNEESDSRTSGSSYSYCSSDAEVPVVEPAKSGQSMRAMTMPVTGELGRRRFAVNPPLTSSVIPVGEAGWTSSKALPSSRKDSSAEDGGQSNANAESIARRLETPLVGADGSRWDLSMSSGGAQKGPGGDVEHKTRRRNSSFGLDLLSDQLASFSPVARGALVRSFRHATAFGDSLADCVWIQYRCARSALCLQIIVSDALALSAVRDRDDDAAEAQALRGASGGSTASTIPIPGMCRMATSETLAQAVELSSEPNDADGDDGDVLWDVDDFIRALEGVVLARFRLV